MGLRTMMEWLDDNGERVREVGSRADGSECWEDRECFIGEQEGTVVIVQKYCDRLS